MRGKVGRKHQSVSQSHTYIHTRYKQFRTDYPSLHARLPNAVHLPFAQPYRRRNHPTRLAHNSSCPVGLTDADLVGERVLVCCYPCGCLSRHDSSYLASLGFVVRMRRWCLGMVVGFLREVVGRRFLRCRALGRHLGLCGEVGAPWGGGMRC